MNTICRVFQDELPTTISRATFHIKHLVTLYRVLFLFVQPNCGCIAIASINNISVIVNIQRRLYPVFTIHRLRITCIKSLLILLMYDSGTCQVPHFKLTFFLIIPDTITKRSCIRGTLHRFFPFFIRLQYRISGIEIGSMRNLPQVCFCNQKVIYKKLPAYIYRYYHRFSFQIRYRHILRSGRLLITRRPLLSIHNSIMQYLLL